ncbi:MAG: hypothetical protein LWW81_04600 [Rhodocyclales bacterium]|nr:hypothetical protein [Rhodocyclales bacterium]
MLWYINDELRRILFAEAPTESAAWLGIPFGLETDVEVVPIQFLTTRYLVFFTNIVQEFGGDLAFAEEMAASWSGGFIPDMQHRLVKFFRADADDQDSIFDPTRWKLENPRQIFQFGRLLISTILMHAEQLPTIRQYLFKPEDARLEKFYSRIFLSNRSTCADAGFAPILGINVDEGGFYGYQRTTN